MIKRLLLICALCVCSIHASAQLGEVHQTNSANIAAQAKQLLEKKGTFVYFCSNCDYMMANIRNIDIDNIKEIESADGLVELEVTGKIARGIKPPVFAGYCGEQIEVSNVSYPLNYDFNDKIDLAYTYVYDNLSNSFVTVASVLGLETDNICTQSIKFTRQNVLRHAAPIKRRLR